MIAFFVLSQVATGVLFAWAMGQSARIGDQIMEDHFRSKAKEQKP